MKNNNNSVSEKELDQLLNRAFSNLDLNQTKNQEIMQSVANHTLNNKNIFAVINGSRVMLKALLTAAIVLITVITFYFMGRKNTVLSGNNNRMSGDLVLSEKSKDSSGINKNNTSAGEVKADISNKQISSSKKVAENKITVNDTFKKTEIVNENSPLRKEEVAVITRNESENKAEDSAYVFPVLTEKEIAENNKQKKKMVNQLINFSKKKYCYIPMGTFTYKGETISLNSFYMENSEVTNLEYRTFLFDLLIQNRKREFIKAKPDQQQWRKEFNYEYLQPMVDNYFSHPAYDNYPMVNISREAAEMYCVWLTQETNKILSEKNKPLLNDVRIPGDAEWTYAASGGLSNAVYPWGTDGIRDGYNNGKKQNLNSKGCFLANFCLRKYKESLDSLKGCNDKPFKEAYTSAGFMIGEGTLTANVYVYNPNINFGLYCMSGNVAEMVKVLKDNKQSDNRNYTPGTKGGSWNSDPEHLKLNSEDEYKGVTTPSCFIGFRPVITFKKTK